MAMNVRQIFTVTIKALLVGRLNIVVDDAQRQLSIPNLVLYSATNITQVQTILEEHVIDHAFLGAGITLEQRIEIVRAVVKHSENVTVHLKDAASGPEGLGPFTRATLAGLQ